jgi:hypothetical protein
VNVVYCADDLSDLVPLCARYLEDDERRESVARAAQLHFDRYLEQSQWASYYLHTAVRRLLGKDAVPELREGGAAV